MTPSDPVYSNEEIGDESIGDITAEAKFEGKLSYVPVRPGTVRISIARWPIAIDVSGVLKSLLPDSPFKAGTINYETGQISIDFVAPQSGSITASYMYDQLGEEIVEFVATRKLKERTRTWKESLRRFVGLDRPKTKASLPKLERKEDPITPGPWSDQDLPPSAMISGGSGLRGNQGWQGYQGIRGAVNVYSGRGNQGWQGFQGNIGTQGFIPSTTSDADIEKLVTDEKYRKKFANMKCLRCKTGLKDSPGAGSYRVCPDCDEFFCLKCWQGELDKITISGMWLCYDCYKKQMKCSTCGKESEKYPYQRCTVCRKQKCPDCFGEDEATTYAKCDECRLVEAQQKIDELKRMTNKLKNKADKNGNGKKQIVNFGALGNRELDVEESDGAEKPAESLTKPAEPS